MDHKTLINQWMSLQQFVDDMGLPRTTCQNWRDRNSIPAWAWLEVIEKAHKRQIRCSLQGFARAAARNHNG